MIALLGQHLDCWSYFEKPGLLGTDVVPLTEKRKSIFGHRLAKLMKKALS